MADTKLLHASIALLALNVAHALDHAVNQNQGLGSIGLIGGGGIFLALVAVALVMTGAEVAGGYVAVLGFGTVAGFLLIHVAPHWSAVSDPYYDSGSVNALSWLVLAACIGISLYAAVVGLNSMRSRTVADRSHG